MEYSYIISAIAVIASIASPIVASAIATKKMQAVTEEKMSNLEKKQLGLESEHEKFRQSISEEMHRLRDEIFDMLRDNQNSLSDKIAIAMDYTKRVEDNKADKSEMAMVVDTTKRIETKLDLLIMRKSE